MPAGDDLRLRASRCLFPDGDREMQARLALCASVGVGPAEFYEAYRAKLAGRVLEMEPLHACSILKRLISGSPSPLFVGDVMNRLFAKYGVYLIDDELVRLMVIDRPLYYHHILHVEHRVAMMRIYEDVRRYEVAIKSALLPLL